MTTSNNPGTDIKARPCPDCGASPGQLHKRGCDIEPCPLCGGQRLSCQCDTNQRAIPWSGEWPGEAECREFGWYAKLVPGKGWQPCGPDDPEAGPDLNRLHTEAVWSRRDGRFILRGDPAQAQAPARATLVARVVKQALAYAAQYDNVFAPAIRRQLAKAYVADWLATNFEEEPASINVVRDIVDAIDKHPLEH